MCLLCLLHWQAGSLPLTITTWEALLMTTEGKGKVLVAHSCPALCNPMDCSPPGSSVHGMLQARILEWVAISYSRGSYQPRDWAWFSCMQADSLPSEPPQKQSLKHKRSTTTHLKPLSTPSNLVQSVLHGWNQGTHHGWHSWCNFPEFFSCRDTVQIVDGEIRCLLKMGMGHFRERRAWTTSV